MSAYLCDSGAMAVVSRGLVEAGLAKCLEGTVKELCNLNISSVAYRYSMTPFAVVKYSFNLSKREYLSRCFNHAIHLDISILDTSDYIYSLDELLYQSGNRPDVLEDKTWKLLQTYKEILTNGVLAR